jgi:Zn-dependent protease
VKGLTWLPFTQLVVWGIMAWVAGRDHPERSWLARLGIAGLTMPVILVSEWAHNLAHAAAARLVDKPMDALRITWGMPLLVYHDINDETVTPRQHALRALGGPAVNLLLLQLAMVFKRLTREGSVGREVANAAVRMNLFLSTASLLPIPGIDGGPILKWSLVEQGYSLEKADQAVKEVNKVVAIGLGGSAALAFRKKRKFIGFILAMFSFIALAVGWGMISEQEP